MLSFTPFCLATIFVHCVLAVSVKRLFFRSFSMFLFFDSWWNVRFYGSQCMWRFTNCCRFFHFLSLFNVYFYPVHKQNVVIPRVPIFDVSIWIISTLFLSVSILSVIFNRNTWFSTSLKISHWICIIILYILVTSHVFVWVLVMSIFSPLFNMLFICWISHQIPVRELIFAYVEYDTCEPWKYESL